MSELIGRCVVHLTVVAGLSMAAALLILAAHARGWWFDTPDFSIGFFTCFAHWQVSNYLWPADKPRDA